MFRIIAREFALDLRLILVHLIFLPCPELPRLLNFCYLLSLDTVAHSLSLLLLFSDASVLCFQYIAHSLCKTPGGGVGNRLCALCAPNSVHSVFRFFPFLPFFLFSNLQPLFSAPSAAILLFSIACSLFCKNTRVGGISANFPRTLDDRADAEDDKRPTATARIANTR